MTLPEILSILLAPSEHHAATTQVARQRATEIVEATNIDRPRTSLALTSLAPIGDTAVSHPLRGESFARRLSPEVRHILRLSSGEYALYNARRDLCGIITGGPELTQLYDSIPAPEPIIVKKYHRTNYAVADLPTPTHLLDPDEDITL